jgi:hypothetical protein
MEERREQPADLLEQGVTPAEIAQLLALSACVSDGDPRF